MSLVFKALQVICATKEEPKPWKMEGREGVSHTATVCCLGHDGKASNIKVKAASADELNAQMAELTMGKPFDLPIVEVLPIFKQGDRRPSAYEFVSKIKVKSVEASGASKKAA